VIGQLPHLAPPETRERELRMVRPQRPGRAELRSRRVDQQQRRRRSLLRQDLLERERRGIHPVEIFDHHHGGLPACKAEHPAGECGEEPLARLLD